MMEVERDDKVRVQTLEMGWGCGRGKMGMVEMAELRRRGW